MKDTIGLFVDYLSGAPVYPALRRLLGLLFIASITSFLFEFLYGKYLWLDLSDYKSILTFFIKGDFFIPLSLFLLVYIAIEFCAFILLLLLTHKKVIRLRRTVLLYKTNRKDIDEIVRNITKISKYTGPLRMSKSVIRQAYNHFRLDITNESFNALHQASKIAKENLSVNFSLLFKALLSISIYFLQLPHFGYLLFFFTITSILVLMYLVSLTHIFFDILPVVAAKAHETAELFLYEQIDDVRPNIRESADTL